MTLTTEELCFALATLYPKAKAVKDAVGKLRSQEARLKLADELAKTWDCYDGLSHQAKMDAACDAYRAAGKGEPK